MEFYYTLTDKVSVVVTDDNVHIKDSYKVGGLKDMRYILAVLKSKYPSCKTFKRSELSLVNEWRAHNLLYTFGLFKSHTKDVDLDASKWYTEIIYFILSILYISY